MSTDTQKERGRPVTHEEAQVSAQRLINSHFHNHDGARCSIPRRFQDDDITVMDYIEQQAAATKGRSGIIHVERVEVEPGKFTILTLLNKPEPDSGPTQFGLIVCDTVRHIAKAHGIHEDKVWYWVEKERRHPTTPITEVKSA